MERARAKRDDCIPEERVEEHAPLPRADICFPGPAPRRESPTEPQLQKGTSAHRSHGQKPFRERLVDVVLVLMHLRLGEDAATLSL